MQSAFSISLGELSDYTEPVSNLGAYQPTGPNLANQKSLILAPWGQISF